MAESRPAGTAGCGADAANRLSGRSRRAGSAGAGQAHAGTERRFLPYLARVRNRAAAEAAVHAGASRRAPAAGLPRWASRGRQQAGCAIGSTRARPHEQPAPSSLPDGGRISIGEARSPSATAPSGAKLISRPFYPWAAWIKSATGQRRRGNTPGIRIDGCLAQVSVRRCPAGDGTAIVNQMLLPWARGDGMTSQSSARLSRIGSPRPRELLGGGIGLAAG